MQTEKRADKLQPGDYIVTPYGQGLVSSSTKHPKKGRWRIEIAGPHPAGVARISWSFARKQAIAVTDRPPIKKRRTQ